MQSIVSFNDGGVNQTLVLLDVGEKRIKLSPTVQGPGPIGGHALQVKLLPTAHHLRDQKAAARVALTQHLREAHVRVYETRTDLMKERSQKENFRPRGPNLVLDHFVLEVKWRLGVTGVQV